MSKKTSKKTAKKIKSVKQKTTKQSKIATANVVVKNKISYTPKISVIMPVYNVAEFLSASLDSVLNQTLRDIELICIDDGSTDNSLEIAKDYAARDNRITVMAQKNLGSGPARNAGMRAARGEYIAFMDSDDFYPNENTLEHMYNTAIANNALICGGSLSRISNGELADPKTFEQGYVFERDGFIKYSDYQFDYGYWRFIYNRDFLLKNNLFFPDYLRQQDPVFFIKTMSLAGKFYALREPTYTYRVSHKQIEWTERKVADTLRAITDCMLCAEKNNYDVLYNNIIQNRINNNWFIRAFKLFADNSEIANLISNMIDKIDYPRVYKSDKNFVLSNFYKKFHRELVSVIIPVYNVEKYLAKCLDSVINQTYKKLEIICVNDGSTDKSADILAEYARKDERIKIITQPNAGLSAARNTGIENCSGEYIYFIDSDDYISNDAIEVLAKIMTTEDVDMAYGRVQCFGDMPAQYLTDKQQYVDRYTRNIGKIETTNNLRANILSTAWNKLYKKSIISKFNLRFPVGLINEDEYWLWAYGIHCKNYYVTDRVLYFYLQRANSIMATRDNDKKIFDILEIYKRIYTFVKDSGKYDKYKDALNTVLNNNIASLSNRVPTNLFDEFVTRLKDVEKLVGHNDACENAIKQFDIKIISCTTSDKTPDVSIIIPVYNVEKYIDDCLNSIESQTLRNLEIICVDDGSTDNSLKILKKHAKQDNRITVISQHNQRQGQARNMGMRFANGNYIFFCDSDDLLEKECLKQLLNKITSEKSDICIFGAKNFSDDISNYTIKDFRDTSAYANRKNKVCTYKDIKNAIFSHFYPWCKLYRRQFIVDNDIKFTTGVFFEDVIFSVKSVILAKRISILDKNMYLYREEQKNSTMGVAKTTDKSDDVFLFLQQVRDFLVQQSLMMELESEYIDFFIEQVKYHVNRVESPEIKQNFYIKALAFIDKNSLNVKNTHLRNFKQFLNDNIKYNKSLIIEINDCHGECIPGYVKYLLDLGYMVDIWINKIHEKDNPFFGEMERNPRVSVQYIEPDKIISMIKSDKMNLYKLCLFNSNTLYEYKFSAIDLIKQTKTNDTKYLAVEHRQENISKILPNNTSMLVLKSFGNKDNVFAVNPHFFGNIQSHRKNAVVQFVTVGHIEARRKNYSLLTNAVKHLLNNGITNFHISVIGRGKLDLPDDIKKYVTVTGRLSFKDMFALVRGADFFLTLLDPNNPEHDRYIHSGTSGSFQLIYGFDIPCLIHSKFASVHNFNNANSIVYDDMNDAMIQAMNMSGQKYEDMRRKLRETANVIYRESLHNLTDAIQYKPNKLKNMVHGISRNIGAYLAFPYHLMYIKAKQRKSKNNYTRKNFYVSLGENCFVRTILTRWGYKVSKNNGELSCPFDLCVSKISGINKILEDNFSHYFDGLRYDDFNAKWRNDTNSLEFNHDLDCGPGDRQQLIDRYKHRISNFLALGKNEKLAFVCSTVDSNTDVNEVNRLYENVARIFANVPNWEFIFANVSKHKLKNENLLHNNIHYKHIPHPYPNYWGEWYVKDFYDTKAGRKFEGNFCRFVINSIKHPKKRDAKMDLCNILSNQLQTYRIDIKNFGAESNSVDVVAPNANVSMPAWYADKNGAGAVLQSHNKHLHIDITAHGDGKLRIDLRGIDKRVNNTRVPVWVTYKSVRVDGHEILSQPVSAWHDMPLIHEMNVKDGQHIVVDIETEPYGYDKSKLTDLIHKLYPSDNQYHEIVEFLYKHYYAKYKNKRYVITGPDPAAYTWPYIRDTVLTRPARDITLDELDATCAGRLRIAVGTTWFESCLIPSNTKKLYVFLSSAAGKVKDPYPVFHRISWADKFDGVCLYLDDPTRNERDFGGGTFYFGYKEHNYCEYIIEIVRRVQANHGIKMADTIFISSSNGGFAALYLANVLQGSKCIVSNPQIDVTGRYERFGLTAQELNEVYDRMCVTNILKNTKSQFFIYFNLIAGNDYFHYNKLMSAAKKAMEIGVYNLTRNITMLTTKIPTEDPHGVFMDADAILYCETIMGKKINADIKNRCDRFLDILAYNAKKIWVRKIITDSLADVKNQIQTMTSDAVTQITKNISENHVAVMAANADLQNKIISHNTKIAEQLRDVANNGTTEILNATNKLHAETAHINNIANELNKSIDDAQSVLRDDVSALGNKISEMSARMFEYKQMFDASTDKIFDTVDLVQSNLRNDVADLGKMVTDIADEIDEHKNSSNELANKINTSINAAQSSVHNDVTDLKHNITEIDTKITNSRDLLEKSVNKINTSIDAVQSSLHADILNINSAIANVSVDVTKSSQSTIDAVKKIDADVQNSVATSVNGITDVLTNEFNSTRDAVQNAVAELPEKIENVGIEIQNTQRHLALNASEQYWAHVYHDTILNSAWLNDKTVSPGRWAISYIVLYVLYRILNEIHPSSILECGLGQSSKLTMQYARANNANLMIFENNPEWLKFFEKQVPYASEYTTILDAEMVTIVPPHESRTYHGFKQTIGSTKFNLVMIDGPLGSKHYSRPQILDVVDNLADSFVIMLDDMNRIGEQETWGVLKEKLVARGIKFVEKIYSSDKDLGVICSPDLEFLTSL